MMNGKVRAFNGDMGMAMSVFKDMVGKVRFVFADPPYKITQARYDKEGFDYKAMWEVIQKMLCPYGVVAVTCSLTAAVEIMRVAPAGWYRYDLVWHKTTPTGFLNAKKYPLRNHELILIFSPMPLGKHTYNPQKTYGHVRKVSKASSKVGCKETELYGKAGLTTYDSTERYPLKDNINRKPNTGMIDQYMDYIKFINDNVDEENKIIYDTIMMIGDASGKEGQFSDSDKKTAENFGCEYMDVDDFVYKYNNR